MYPIMGLHVILSLILGHKEFEAHKIMILN